MTPTLVEPDHHYFIKVLDVRRERFVEFELSLNGPDLAVELIMPVPELLRFAADRRARFLRGSDEAETAFARLLEREGASAPERERA